MTGESFTIGKILFWVVTTGLTVFILGFIALTLLIFTLSIGLPDITQVRPQLSTEIFDRDGNLLYTIHGEQNREYVPLEKISKNLVNATIAIEDGQFWSHGGLDVSGIGKAMLHEIFGIGKKRGGSTITQQYAKNMFLTTERSYVRKLKEVILAVRLERAYTKEKILELYLNQIPYGNNAYGAQKAAEIYFGKNAADLTLGESALLAALPQAPSYYNPYGQNLYSTLTKDFTPEELAWRNVKEESDFKEQEFTTGLIGRNVNIAPNTQIYLKGRSDIILKRMLELGYLKPEEKQAAWNEIQKIAFKKYQEPIKAPHFVLYVKEILEKKYGKELVEQGGLKVYTTLNGHLQEFAEKIIAEKSEPYQKNFQSNNTSLVSIDPKTGQILAMIGSRDFFNDEIDGKVNVALRPRNPGSAFKPIVYAQVFYNGYGPATVLYDTPVKLGPDTPQNYDGKFHGPMPIRRALGQSRNIPAIKAYFLAGEQKPIIQLAEKIGITTLDYEREYGYPLAIGSGEVRLIDMVTAFGTFAATGRKPALTPILKVENSEGKILEEYKEEEYTKQFTEVLDPQIAFLINNILSDTSVNLGQNLNLINHKAAVKTGTSTKETKAKGTAYPMDLWTIGYTPQIVTGVWIGNSRGEQLAFMADGYTAAAPIWKAVMSEYLKDKPNEEFSVPEGIKHVSIGTATGLLPGPNTPPNKIKEEVFASFAVPTQTEDIYVEVEIDKNTNLLANAYCPEDAIEKKLFQRHQDPIPNPYWETGVRQWLANAGSAEASYLPLPPTEESPSCKKEYADLKPQIEILNPTSLTTVTAGIQPVEVKYSAPNGLKTLEYYFDNQLNYTSISPKGKVRISKLHKPGSTHLIRAKAIDTYGYSAESVIEVKFEGDNVITEKETSNSSP